MPDWINSETLYVAAQAIFLGVLVAWVFAARDRFYEKNGRDWRDDIW